MCRSKLSELRILSWVEMFLQLLVLAGEVTFLFHESRRFSIVFTKSRRWILSWASCIHCTSLPPFSFNTHYEIIRSLANYLLLRFYNYTYLNDIEIVRGIGCMGWGEQGPWCYLLWTFICYFGQLFMYQRCIAGKFHPARSDVTLPDSG
jgi:hypothetical protein